MHVVGVGKRNGSHRWPVIIWLSLLACLAVATWSPAVGAEVGLEGWRNAIRETRLLADNDVPAAYKQALHLQDTLPAEATPAMPPAALGSPPEEPHPSAQLPTESQAT